MYVYVYMLPSCVYRARVPVTFVFDSLFIFLSAFIVVCCLCLSSQTRQCTRRSHVITSAGASSQITRYKVARGCGEETKARAKCGERERQQENIRQRGKREIIPQCALHPSGRVYMSFTFIYILDI